MSTQKDPLPLKRLDPRVRLLLMIVFIIFAFISPDIQTIAVVLVILLLIIFVGGVMRKAVGVLKIMAPMFVVAILLWSTLYSYSLFYSFEATGIALKIGIYMALRLFIMILAPFLFIATTSPSEMVATLSSLGIPEKAAFFLGLTFRHVVGMAEEYRAIKEAQISRGVELDRESLVKRIRNYVPVIIPFLIRSVEVAERVALAMELKLYGVGRRSRYFRLKMRRIDFFITFLILAICSMYILWRYGFLALQ
ncbi:MAG TPA: energy-coupling factor transporter transmembrane protein EcfT [Candidatus Bathyarchaeota archaeon]|nr:energy-coupling factor transporter transmembrane protein EcfT [Candidatus Bathyarchaeota archaeon]